MTLPLHHDPEWLLTISRWQRERLEVAMAKLIGAPEAGEEAAPPKSKVTIYPRHYIPEPNSGCWLWTGRIMRNGYGQAHGYNPRRVISAHRASYQYFIGPVSRGVQVCHRCDVRSCINPDHLFLGSAKDNQTDMAAKGRSLRGSRHNLALLHERDINPIRRRVAAGEPYRSIAKDYGIAPGTIYNIKSGKQWKHVPVELDDEDAAPDPSQPYVLTEAQERINHHYEEDW